MRIRLHDEPKLQTTAKGKAHLLEQITISPNQRFLTTAEGVPLFLLGDVAFELLYRLTRAEIDSYLSTRASQGFNLVTVNVFSILQRLDVPSSEGELPLVGMDPAHPNESFFSLVDHLASAAAREGIHLGLYPFTPSGDQNVGIFTAENAYGYGSFLGSRYRHHPMIWILGGNFAADTEASKDIWRSMAKGIADGTGRSPTMTFLPPMLKSSSEYLHNEPWLTFNTVQTCHSARDIPTHEWISADYSLEPSKPTWEIEYAWEDGPVNWDTSNGRFDDYDVRKGAYWSLFAGGFGCMYGCYDVFRFYRDPQQADEYEFDTPGIAWADALHRPGADQMRHVRALMQSRPMLTRIPDQDLLLSDPGVGAAHVRATRDDQGRYAFVYAVLGEPLAVNPDRLSDGEIRAWWFDPRNGSVVKIGEFSPKGPLEFEAPTSGYGQDWVLAIDSVAEGWDAPGEGPQ